MLEVLKAIYYWCDWFADVVLTWGALSVVAIGSSVITFVVMSYIFKKAHKKLKDVELENWDMHLDSIQMATDSLRQFYSDVYNVRTNSDFGDIMREDVIKRSNARYAVEHGDWLRDFLWYNNALGLTVHIRRRTDEDFGATKEEQDATRKRLYEECRTYVGSCKYEKYENDVNMNLHFYGLNRFNKPLC